MWRPHGSPSGSGSCRAKLQTSRALLWGGATLGVGVAMRSCWTSRSLVAHCEGNRLAGVIQHTLEQEDQNFDWRRLWTYLEPHTWELIGAVLVSPAAITFRCTASALCTLQAALIVAFINIRIPNLLGDLVNTLARYANTYVMDPINNSFVKDVSKPASNLLSLYLLQSGFTFVYIYLLSRVGEQMAARMRQDLFKQIVLQDISFFDENRTGELVNRLTADVQDFKTSFKQFVAHGLRSSAQLIGGSVSLFMISPHMAAIALASVPCVVMFMSYLGRKLRALSKNSQAQVLEVCLILNQDLIESFFSRRSARRASARRPYPTYAPCAPAPASTGRCSCSSRKPTRRHAWPRSWAMASLSSRV